MPQYALYIAIPACLAFGLFYFRKRLLEHWGYVAGIVLMSVLALCIPYILNRASNLSQALLFTAAAMIAAFIFSLVLIMLSRHLGMSIIKRNNMPYSLKRRGGVVNGDTAKADQSPAPEEDYGYDNESDDDEYYEYDDTDEDEYDIPADGAGHDPAGFVYWIANDNADELAKAEIKTELNISEELYDSTWESPEIGNETAFEYLDQDASELEEAPEIEPFEPITGTDDNQTSFEYSHEVTSKLDDAAEVETVELDFTAGDTSIQPDKEEFEKADEVRVEILSMDELYSLGSYENTKEDDNKPEKNPSEYSALLSELYHEAVLLKRSHEYRRAAEAFDVLQQAAQDAPVTRKLADFERLEVLMLADMKQETADAVFEILERGYDLDGDDMEWLKGVMTLLDD